MLFTDATEKLQIVTTAAVATHVHASGYRLYGRAKNPLSCNTRVTTATTTDIVPAIWDNKAGAFDVTEVYIRNAHAATAQTVTVQHVGRTSAGVAQVSELIRVTLLAGEQLQYKHGEWKVLNAAGSEKVTNAVGTGRFLGSTLVTATGNHTTDPEATRIKVRLVGGGGGGGGVTNVGGQAAAAGGGGAGAYGEVEFNVAGNTAYAVTVGAGGAGVAEAAGGNGGDTDITVGAVTAIAPGGTGGPQGEASAALAAYLGGAGGAVPTDCDVEIEGQDGQPGVILIVAGAVGVSGAGGSSPLGVGGQGLAVAGNGAVGVGYGAGGGGALRVAAAGTGGNGTAGCLVIDEYA